MIALSVIFLLGFEACLGSGNDWLVNKEDLDLYSYTVPGIRDRHDQTHFEQPYYREKEDHIYHNHVERPCAIHDVKCIRRVLSHYTGCTPTHGPAPDPYIIKELPMDIPHSNVTITLNNAQHKGINSGKIKEFFINKKTDTLILEVVFGSLVTYSPKTVVTYYRKGKEPIEAWDYTTSEFRDLSLTLIMKGIKEGHLAKSHVYAYISDADPPVTLGPGLLEVKKGLTHWNLKWIKDLALTAMETAVTRANIYMAVFLQNNICDFSKIN